MRRCPPHSLLGTFVAVPSLNFQMCQSAGAKWGEAKDEARESGYQASPHSILLGTASIKLLSAIVFWSRCHGTVMAPASPHIYWHVMASAPTRNLLGILA